MEVILVNVKCILGYYDTKLSRHVKVGEEFEVNEDRAGQLVKAKVCELTTPTTEKVAKAKAKPRKKDD